MTWSGTQHRRGRILGLALLLAFVSSATAWAEGFYYEAMTTERLESGKERSRLLVRGWVDGDGAKIEFADQKGTMFGEGSYLVTKDGGRTLYMVSPKEEAYSKWDLEALFAHMNAILEATGPILDIDFSNAKSEKLGESDGGTLLGYPTRKLEYRLVYDMRMSVMGMKRQANMDTHQEIWVTDRLNDAGFKVWLRPDRLKTGDPDLDTILAADMGRLRGFPLKTVLRTTSTTGKGKQQVSISTMEVTTLRQEAVPASTFELPSGYEERPFLPGMPQQSEGGAQASPTGAGADERTESENERQGGPLKGLKGIFGKKKKDG